jgi:recombinational DNA repair ATPase RecF
MWIERVLARAFGPLVEDSLQLGEGMTVITGPNEAGKTSWHAALRLALTGVRRGPGRTKEAASVIEHHRPWDSPDRWEVEARLHLADGRTIDISQDLAGRVACRARDVTLGDDVSSEIINDGTPDASRWLGLDRDSFTAVAAVSQAQIMAVADSAGALQDHMQRAAASHGTDATAAEAITGLKAFRKEAVGAVRVGATGPLWSTMREQEAADAALAEARRRHADYLDREARLEEAARAHDAAQRALAVAEASRSLRDATDQAARAERAAQLAAAYPEPPAALAVRTELADGVAAALESWRRRPTPVPLGGSSAAELREQLAALPAIPVGDRRPDRSVVDAIRTLDLAEEALRLHGEGQPRLAPPDTPARPPIHHASPLMQIMGAAGAGLAGLAFVLLGQTLPGISLLVVAGALAAWAWRRATPGRLVGSTAHAVADQSERLAGEWEARATRLQDALRLAEDGLRGALRERSAGMDGDLRAAVVAYDLACTQREDLARAAAAADGLRRAIEAREVAEEGAARAAAAASSAEAALRMSATHVGQAGDATPEELVAALTAWQGEQAEAVRASEVAIREWQELTGLLDGRTLADLQAEADRGAEVAARLAQIAGEDALLPSGREGEATVAAARAEASRSNEVLAALSGELRLLASTLPDVAEVEERAEAARLELQRVQELAAVIDETLSLLEAAERRVHRDLAPILTASVQRHLPAITGGAYVEVGMNPRDLSVDVKEARTGQWRDARLLSEGTREQIYLLLRVAMAEHLVTTDDMAPLLLDEVTAQADSDRKRRVLDVLHELSADRQVILFSHDDDVVAWAADSLSEPRDRLIRIGTPVSSPLPGAAIR